jgi:predicted lipoprotein with Yx(FWY)xxD motif
MNKLIFAILATAFAANVAIAQSVAETNGILADASGRALYTFDKDASNKSNCNDGCAANWSPFLVKEGDRTPATFSVITRDDGAKQWALNGKPLYFFAADVQAGEAKGDGKGGVWHVVRGESQRSEAKPAAATRSSGWSYGSGY